MEVAISDNSLTCQQSDSKVEENEPAVSVISTAEYERTEVCFCLADYKLQASRVITKVIKVKFLPTMSIHNQDFDTIAGWQVIA